MTPAWLHDLNRAALQAALNATVKAIEVAAKVANAGFEACWPTRVNLLTDPGFEAAGSSDWSFEDDRCPPGTSDCTCETPTPPTTPETACRPSEAVGEGGADDCSILPEPSAPHPTPQWLNDLIEIWCDYWAEATGLPREWAKEFVDGREREPTPPVATIALPSFNAADLEAIAAEYIRPYLWQKDEAPHVAQIVVSALNAELHVLAYIQNNPARK